MGSNFRGKSYLKAQEFKFQKTRENEWLRINWKKRIIQRNGANQQGKEPNEGVTYSLIMPQYLCWGKWRSFDSSCQSFGVFDRSNSSFFKGQIHCQIFWNQA